MKTNESIIFLETKILQYGQCKRQKGRLWMSVSLALCQLTGSARTAALGGSSSIRHNWSWQRPGEKVARGWRIKRDQSITGLIDHKIQAGEVLFDRCRVLTWPRSQKPLIIYFALNIFTSNLNRNQRVVLIL